MIELQVQFALDMFQRVLRIAGIIDEGFPVKNKIAPAGFWKALLPLRKGFSQLPVLPGVLIMEGVVVVVVLGDLLDYLEYYLEHY